MSEPVDLDDVVQLEERDPGGMLSVIESFPKQCTEALRLGGELQDLPASEDLKRIAFAGMGGSGISGEILRYLIEEATGLAISVHRSYRLPSLLGQDTLLVAVSYSGNTEETLSAVDDAIYLGCRIMAVYGGGSLLEMARGYRWPSIQVPGGLQPRAALGYLSLPVAVVVERMGLMHGFIKVANEAVEYIAEKGESWGRLSPGKSNFAKKLAGRIFNRLAVIYGTEGLMEVAAYRWKCQLNENAKVPAFCHVLPEMDHNEIVGWHELDEVSNKVEAIFLVEEDVSPSLAKRVEITADLLQDRVGGVTVIHVGGKTRTEKMFSAIYLGDFVSAYLAVLRNVDPTPVEAIAELKERMAREE
ncbi:MAG: bifunctional phosphoglucose/phosphomannose isomerase [Actinomycetota bacterium]|nr:bifunctional phosphoglucose/phosphomannose isomerase [Actinomycetota bacterium]